MLTVLSCGACTVECVSLSSVLVILIVTRFPMSARKMLTNFAPSIWFFKS